jgi:hypothetical protein
MKRTLLIAIAVGSLVIPSVHAMDGVAISIAQRYAMGCDYGPYIPEVQQEDQWFCIGNILRYNIASNAVTSRDTIYNSRRSGYAQYPTFSYDGQHVAFFRWGIYDSTGIKTGGSKDSNWIAVMDVNGSNLRNLVKIAQPALNASMDWPMPKGDGNWIYYIKPKTGGRQLYAKACEGNELWRVNADNPTQNAKVTAYPAGTVAAPAWERRFSLSLDSKYAAVQPMYSTPIVNIAMNFSPLNADGWASCTDTVTLSGCNICVSTGGNYVAHYNDVYHRKVFMYKWDHAAHALILCGADPCFIFGLDDLPAWTSNAITFDADAGAEQIRWSVNSEKWLCRWIGCWGDADNMRFGSNQLLTNWVDHQAIKTSNNAKPTSSTDCNTIMWGTDAGDLWVTGPVGQIEDTTGAWHTGVINQSLRSATAGQFSISINPSGITISLPDGRRHKAELISASGAVLCARTGIAQLFLDIAQVPAGMYLARIDNGAFGRRIPIIGR